jgi:predicted nucleotidyltransferase
MTYQVEVDMSESLVEQMVADALEAERLRIEARAKLVGAVRRGAAAGMSQREIARAVNRSQPEVARLLRFFPASERGSALAKRRREVIDLAAQHGFRNVRVFGSVARGEDGPESDIDLLVTLPNGASLFDIGALEAGLTALLGERVDLVPDDGLRPHSRDEILAEAVPL